MTSLLEKLVAKIAPHHCLCCSKEDNIVCEACAFDLFGSEESACFLCQTPTADFATCQQCRPRTALQYVWFTANYEGTVAEVIKLLKFERASAAAEPLARAMANALPSLPAETLIVPVPTATSRIRMRGYDQTVLLANEMSKKTGMKVQQLLFRTVQERQLGASRQRRSAQIAHAFEAADCADKTILLVDDVVTTGATLCAATRAVQRSGAKSVMAVVAARTL